MSVPSPLSQAARGKIAPPSPERDWHGPRIIVVAFVSTFVSTGFIFSIYGVVIGPMAESFGASMVVMGLMPPIYHLMSSVVSPLLGRHLGWLRIRRALLVGAVLVPVGLVAVAQSTSAGQAGLYFGAFVVLGSIAMGPLPTNTLITNWYGISRGRAMGLASVGGTLAGTILPPVAAFLIGVAGWREALMLLGLAGAAVSLPVFGLLAVDRPSDLGQRPEGEGVGVSASAPTSATAEPLEPLVSTTELLQVREFWLIAATFGLLFSGGLVLVTYTVLYARELGMTLQAAAWLMMGRSLASVGGQVGLARLSDRVGRRLVLGVVILAQGTLFAFIVWPPNLLGFVAAGIGFGFFGGALVALRASMVAAVFGRRDFSKVSGLMVPAAMPFQISVVPLAGLIFDRTEDYSVALGYFLWVYPVAAAMLYFIRDPHQRHPNTKWVT